MSTLTKEELRQLRRKSRSRYAQSDIDDALRLLIKGTPHAQVAARYNVSEATLGNWRRKALRALEDGE